MEIKIDGNSVLKVTKYHFLRILYTRRYRKYPIRPWNIVMSFIDAYSTFHMDHILNGTFSLKIKKDFNFSSLYQTILAYYMRNKDALDFQKT